MASLPCLNSSRRALYRVFITPPTKQLPLVRAAASPASPASLSSPVPVPVPVPVRAAGRLLPFCQTRGYAAPKGRHYINPRAATTPEPELEFADLGYDPRYTTTDAVERSGRDRLPRDHEITDPRIMVLKEGIFDGPLSTRTVMSRLDMETQSLRMVKTYVPGQPTSGIPPEYAVCHVVNKLDEYQREREKKLRKRLGAAPKTKEVEINWAISEHDLQTKMARVLFFLDKGNKVDVIFGQKKGGKSVDDASAQRLVDKVRRLVDEAGAREYKPLDGEMNRTVRVYVQRPLKM